MVCRITVWGMNRVCCKGFKKAKYEHTNLHPDHHCTECWQTLQELFLKRDKVTVLKGKTESLVHYFLPSHSTVQENCCKFNGMIIPWIIENMYEADFQFGFLAHICL